MFSKFMRRLFVSLNVSKCNFHNGLQISDADFNEMVGKHIKVQVSRTLLFFDISIARIVYSSIIFFLNTTNSL